MWSRIKNLCGSSRQKEHGSVTHQAPLHWGLGMRLHVGLGMRLHVDLGRYSWEGNRRKVGIHYLFLLIQTNGGVIGRLVGGAVDHGIKLSRGEEAHLQRGRASSATGQ